MFYAFDHSGVEADIYTMAKGMGNGFPIGGIAIAPHIKPRHGMLGTTFGGNHLACAAGLAVLEVIEKEDLVKHAQVMGAYLIEILKNVPGLRNVRGVGLMIGFNMPEDFKELRQVLLNEYKIFTGEAKPDVIRLLPALNISKTEVDLFANAMQTILNKVSN
jgi:acetylornithine aminotransferase